MQHLVHEEEYLHKQTWQHPKSHKWHCIDYVITKKDQLRKCLDVSVAISN